MPAISSVQEGRTAAASHSPLKLDPRKGSEADFRPQVGCESGYLFLGSPAMNSCTGAAMHA